MFLATSLFASDNFVFLGLDDFSMSRESIKFPLIGTVAANKVVFLYDDQNIEINGSDHQLYIADVFLTDSRLVFNNDFLKFSTPLDSTNPLYMLDSIKAKDCDIEINTKGALIDSVYLDFSLKDVLIKIKNAQLDCKSDIGFTMDVDEICLKDSTIKKLGEDKAVVEISSLNQEKPASVKIDLNKITVEPHSISAIATQIIGKFNGATFTLNEGFLTCSKIHERSLDLESFFKGCLVSAKSKARVLHFKSKYYDVEVEEAQLEIGEDFYHLDAAYSNFETGSQRTRASKFRLDCLKLPMPNDAVDSNTLLKGCFDRGSLFIGHLDPDNTKNKSKDIIDTDNLKDINLNFEDNTFSLSAKSKIIFRFSFKAHGTTEWNETRDVIKFHIQKASMASFPATKMMMRILAKFIGSERMSIEENTITIKF